MMREMRAGVIGVGFIGALHLEAIRRVPGAQVAAISEPDAGVLAAAQERFCVARACADWRDLVNDPGIDVIHNCTPNHLHDEINRAAILAGKHIYSEKPLSNSAAVARELWQLAVDKGVAHGVNHQYRLNAAVQEMKARRERGDCGRPLLVRGHYLQESHARANDYNWRMSPQTGPSRALSDIGTHWADTAMCVMGQPIVSVLADVHIHHPVRTDPVTGERHAMHSDDSASVFVRFADGTPGVFTVSKVSCGHKNDLCLIVDGENYAMTWHQETPDRLELGMRDAPNGTLYMNKALTDPAVAPYITTPNGHVMGWSDALRNAVCAFYTAIWEGTFANPVQPYATFESGFRGMALVEACLRSSAERRWVDVAL